MGGLCTSLISDEIKTGVLRTFKRMKITKKSLALWILAIVLCAGIVFYICSANKSVVQFRLGEREPGKDLEEMTKSGSGEKVYLYKKVEMSNTDIADASVIETDKGVNIEITFTDDGKEKLEKLTRENTGKILGILVDGKLVWAPVIHEAIPGGKAIISGSFTLEEAKAITEKMQGK